MKKNLLSRIARLVVIACLSFTLTHLFALSSCAAGLGADPGEIKVENVPLGKKVAASELAGKGMKLKIQNKDAAAHSYTLDILKMAQTTSNLKGGYEDIPDTKWISPEEGEVQIKGNSSREVELYLTIPKEEKYYNRKYQAVIEIKGKKDKPTDLFVLAVRPGICFSTEAKEQKYPKVVDAVKGQGKSGGMEK